MVANSFKFFFNKVVINGKAWKIVYDEENTLQLFTSAGGRQQ